MPMLIKRIEMESVLRFCLRMGYQEKELQNTIMELQRKVSLYNAIHKLFIKAV